MQKKYHLKKKYKISALLIMMLLVLLSSLAASYSLWVVTREQPNENLVVSGCFSIIYNDLDSNEESTSINLNNTYPISDELGMQLSPYTVKLKNNCSVAATYTLTLSSINTNTLDDGYINYYLTNTVATYGPLNVANDLTAYTFNNNIKSTIESEKNVTLKNSYILATGNLNPTDEETYELRLWVKSDAEDVMEKEFSSVISFEAYATNIQS